MVISFKNVVLIDSYAGTSQKGNPYGRIKFLSDDFDVYEIFCSADSAKALSGHGPKHRLDHLDFDLVPDRQGGARLVPRF